LHVQISECVGTPLTSTASIEAPTPSPLDGRVHSIYREVEQSVQQGTSKLLSLPFPAVGTADASPGGGALPDTRAGALSGDAPRVSGDATGEICTTSIISGATPGAVSAREDSAQQDGSGGPTDGGEPDVGGRTSPSGMASSSRLFVRSLGRKRWMGRWGGSTGGAVVTGVGAASPADADFAATIKAAEVRRFPAS